MQNKRLTHFIYKIFKLFYFNNNFFMCFSDAKQPTANSELIKAYKTSEISDSF